MKSKLPLSIILLFIASFSLKAQTIDVNTAAQAEAVYTPKDLIEKVLINNTCATVTNITSSVFGAATDRQNKSYGYFKSKPGSGFPFKEGIVISTGKAFSIGETGSFSLDSGTTGNNDPDLSASLGEPNLLDASVIEFDFVPKADEISFRYIMASEEYQNNYPCSYADGFAFLLRESGTTAYTNLAVLPGTTTPVSVTNVHGPISGATGCAAANPTYFAGNNLGDTNFDGRTTILTAKGKVKPNVKYHIKLVIADNRDSRLDSAVFLEKGSFNLGLNLGTDFLSATNTSVCGTEKLLSSNITADTYQWYKDDVIIPGATNKDYLANLGNGKYTCKITTGTCNDEDDVTLNFSDAPVNNTAITPLATCSNNLTTNIDLTAKTNEILAGQSNATFEVLFFSDAAYTTQITAPTTHVNNTADDTIYVRIRNKTATNCFVDSSFKSQIFGVPIPQTPVNYEECDDTANGGDTDGFFNNFLLNSKDNEILGTLPTATYEVSYHTTLAGANTDKNTDVIDKNIPYRNVIANSQIIYVRVENKNNPACNDTSKSFNLVVNPLPVVNNPIIVRQCDTDADLNTNINLTLSQMNISANHANETFKYYPTQNDAINNTAEITNTTAHPVSNGDVIWVRTISNKNCYRISRIEIVVGFSADVAYNTPFETCDDFLDANGNDNANNDDTDGIATFNISSVVNDVKALFPAAIRPSLDVLIFETIADRDAVLNAIPNLTNYRNKNVPAQTPQPLYIKIINTVNNDCTGIGSFTIWAQQPPVANKPLNFVLCDDFNSGSIIDGTNVNINLRDRVNTILGPTQTTGFTVTFHTSAADANTGNNPIPNDTNYTNQTKDKETIYVRVVNNTTGCFNDHVTFDIIINPLPTIANAIPNLEVCDVATPSDGDPRNRLAQNIDLSQRDADILNGRDPNLFEVSYHRTLQNAIDGVLPLSKTNYSNDPATTNFPANLLSDDPATEIIHVSLLNKTTGCRYGIATLQLVVMPEPNIPLNITNYIDCDNQSDASNDDTNGINGDITLKNKIPQILANYPTTEHGNYKVTFHSSLADAQSGSNPLDENKYENTANNQTIYVRVVNTKTSCVHDDLNFNIVINPLPAFTVDTPVIVCLNNPQTRLEPINPNATYSYEWTLKGDPKVLSKDAFLDVLKGGTYVVKATMQDGTGCTRSREIVVNESINPTLNDDDIVIVDDTNNNGLDNYSIKIITDNKNLGIGDYEFAIVDEDNNMTGFQDDPLFNNIYGGFYNVIVRDKNGCKPDAQLKVSVIEYPKFITPNGDGKNDTWKIKGADSSFYPSSNITVVDRYGKIVAIIPIDSQGWDGTYNGKQLPSSDYWFKIQLVDRKGKMYQHQGHFSVLRK
ncbi:choice-of-anchor L domain-containing protein [uncultured Tenacibaculum sp.]|uniref:T9SS type B sorting domain-containing protein n=1 Tax=uncultured Tenacibaculum sp. TaxID=174713 RepID=UPI00261976B4|nr:choice-of-anchor L domain-containing protein [uncultured Tenacibaculum sp.]